MHDGDKSYREVTIFVIDDDDVDAMAIKRALKQRKLANPMLRARDGMEALAMLRDGDTVPRPCIILLDLNMPRMNGIEFLEHLRKDPELSDTVVFILSTSNHGDDKAAAYHFNVAGYIVKRDVGNGFMQVIDLIDHYWKVVELPQRSAN